MEKHLFNWENFLKLSEELIDLDLNNKEINEAIYRTVCSRCYYATFKKLEDFLKEFNIVDLHASHKEILKKLKEIEENISTFTSRDRRSVLRQLKNRKNKLIFRAFNFPNQKDLETIKDYRKSILRLRHRRVIADYRKKREVKKREAVESVKLCKKTLKHWNDLAVGIISLSEIT